MQEIKRIMCIFVRKKKGRCIRSLILLLKKQKGEVRSIDIANELDHSKSSVSRAVGILKDNGYITVEDNGLIHFTEKGRKPIPTPAGSSISSAQRPWKGSISMQRSTRS
jgi:CTP-dependent riboflavin kinase